MGYCIVMIVSFAGGYLFALLGIARGIKYGRRLEIRGRKYTLVDSGPA